MAQSWLWESQVAGKENIQLRGFVCGGISEEFCNFYCHLMETVFPVVKLTQNCCIQIHKYFLEKWQFNHRLGPLQTYRA